MAMMAQERSIVEEGYAGDVMGVYDPGIFEIGDTLTSARSSRTRRSELRPEHFVRAYLADPMRRKQLKTGLDQLAQEGTIQLYRPPEGRSGDPVLGAVGRLQLEVVKFRLKNEYDVDVRLEPWTSSSHAGVPRGRDARGSPCLRPRARGHAGHRRAQPSRGALRGQWQLNSAERTFKGIVYSETAHGGAVKRE